MDIDDMKNQTTSNLKAIRPFEDIDPYSLFTVLNTQRDSMHENEESSSGHVHMKTRKSEVAAHKKQS